MEAAVSAGCDCILNDGDFDPLGGNGKTGHSFLKKNAVYLCPSAGISRQ
jgi:hypothetical protein